MIITMQQKVIGNRGSTGRYTVSIAGDDDKYTDVSAISGGSNGTTISSNAVQVDADKALYC